MIQETEISRIYKPVFIKKDHSPDHPKFASLIDDYHDKIILDLFASQKKELFKIRNPTKRLTSAQLDQMYTDWATDKNVDQEGEWIFYPWSDRLLHILEKDEFIELRTSRNQYKITPQEQASLAGKRIGIIGLSVGNAVALSLATERTCGKLKLADFDTIELSNLNRIKTGIHNIGINKAVVTAREIAEIDPFLDVECFEEGITKENLDQFLLEGGKLDLLIDECDDLSVKVLCRVVASSYQIPVMMETSDRGMLDVERFDLEPGRPVLHGLLDGIPLEKFEHISEQERLPLVLRIVNAVNGSKRGKMSLVEIGQTISTWPQLASAVTLGAGVVTDVSRRILLDRFHESGRYYVDLEDIVGNKNPAVKPDRTDNPYQPFDQEEAIKIADLLPYTELGPRLDEATVAKIVEAACLAPSTGNDQPWKWVYRNGRLHLFHDRYRSYSFGDFDQVASNISFGAAYENLLLKSRELGVEVNAAIFPLGEASPLIAAIDFYKMGTGYESDTLHEPEMVGFIESRNTNRNPSQPVPVPENHYAALREAVESIEGAAFHFVSDKNVMHELGVIIGECDRVRLLNPNGHHDFVKREMKWTPQDAESAKDGIDVRTLGLSGAQVAALSIIRDEEISKTLKEIGGGGALVNAALMTVSTASALGIITMPSRSYVNFFRGGMAMERMWLKAEQLGYAIHPLISPFYLFPRIVWGNGEGLDEGEISRLEEQREKFLSIMPFDGSLAEVFLFKIAKAEKPVIKSYRLPLTETLFSVNH